MTNNWTDIANATLVLAWGANPAENHPACMAHVNKARAGGLTGAHPNAKLIVVDPRKTRTACQINEATGDRYIRIRPGTDIALQNGVINWIINNIAGTQKTDWETYLDTTTSQPYRDDLNADVTVDHASKYTDARIIVNAAKNDYSRATLTVGAQTISNFPRFAVDHEGTGSVDTEGNAFAAGEDTVFNNLAAHVAPYSLAVVADICGCSQTDITFLAQAIIDNSRCSSTASLFEPNNAGYRCTTILYAMGITQHTYGSQNIKGFANLQTLMGNMGRCGGGINALRGIHNVQGSTDMGLLYGNTIAYGFAQPTEQTSDNAKSFGRYMDKLWGYNQKNPPTNDYATAYIAGAATTVQGLQQRGWFNQITQFFGPGLMTSEANIQAVFDLYPKGNGNQHITMFRDMIAGTTNAAVVWGQNPAITEPNQGKVRAGLAALDLLVVVDMFATETAMCDRHADGYTYLIPAASHVEEAGSVTNSGRTLQWRERALAPRGNSKADIELLLRFAKALDDGNAFSHIETAWTALGKTYTSVYDELYKYYGGTAGWTPAAATWDFESVSMTGVDIWHGEDTAATLNQTVTGSEAVCEKIFREYAAGSAAGGTVWIYTGGYTPSPYAGQGGGWTLSNRAKSRDTADLDAAGPMLNNHGMFKNWGYSWLVNRRVLYNNGDLTWDQSDNFQGPERCARMFVSAADTGITWTAGYSRGNYRHIHGLKDIPDTCLSAVAAPHVTPRRFPAHTEPYETPRADLAATWGRNVDQSATTPAAWNLVKPDTLVVGRDAGAIPAGHSMDDALVLTTIRCVEHFQGGPITRNNAWNVEAEPVPWVEINSWDASARNIKDGDLINVITARGDSTSGQEAITPNATAGWAQGFVARVGVGNQLNQRVGHGVVAIPWHWGEQGLGTGSRANDLCIDSWDANTTIPESKACLCWLEQA